MPLSSAPEPSATQVFRRIWLARYRSLEEARALASTAASGCAGELVELRVGLAQLRLQPQSSALAPEYEVLAQRLGALGDRDGAVIARSFALGTAHLGGNLAAAISRYEDLGPAISQISDELERHVAMGASLFLYQAQGNLAAYMRQACLMLQLARSVGHPAMQAASECNVGIAFYLAGDEPQARQHLERALANPDLGRWIRFNAVAILAEILVSAGETERALPLLHTWSFPHGPRELDPQAVAHLHALGAEVFAARGETSLVQRYLLALQLMPAEQRSADLRSMVAVARAKHLHSLGRGRQALESLAEAIALSGAMSGGDRALAARFWQMAADVAGDQGQWEQAYRYLRTARAIELKRRDDAASVRWIHDQFQIDEGVRAAEFARLDALTGIANRKALVEVGEGWLARGLSPVAAKVNLRRFNAINQTLGREVADMVLQAVAQRLKECCARFEHAVPARMYADQFALLMAPSLLIDQLRDVAAQLFAAPLEVAGQRVDISCAWGVASTPAQGGSIQRLMSQAQAALHEDRRTGAGWTHYHDGLDKAEPFELSMISELARAAHADEFVLELQPKFALGDAAVVGFEALIRWNHPARGLLPPGTFIPFAESTGSIKVITRWALARAMTLSAQLRDRGLQSQIAVNVSAHDISPSFATLLKRLLRESGAHAQDIRLELTEGAAMREPAAVIRQMHQIRELGFAWSIDDFGTGQSSLSYLHLLPVSELKIDRSFVQGATRAAATRTLLSAAIDLGKSLGLTTVGEGAETAEQWELLRELRCDSAQGWFACRPMPEAQVINWLKEKNYSGRQPR